MTVIGEALISEHEIHAVLRAGAWAAEVDPRDLREWAIYGGFALSPEDGGGPKVMLRDSADGYLLIRARAELATRL